MGCLKSKPEKDEIVDDGSTLIPERKIILIGDSGVGKTAIIHQYIMSGFQDKGHMPTTGVKNQYKTVDIPNGGQNGRPAKIKLDIWDTAGDDSMRNIMKTFYNGAAAVIIVYSVTSPTSFKSVEQHLEVIDQYCSKDVFKVVVGNKCDLDNDRRVDFSELSELGEQENVKFFETSALQKNTINSLFNCIIDHLA